MIELGPNRYGKSKIRLVVVRRLADRHELRDLTVDVALEGDFGAAHTDGDNARVVATDTMKNTVYAFAADRLTGSIEHFGAAIAEHFAAYPPVTTAIVTLREHDWDRLDGASGEPAPDAFVRSGRSTRTAVVTASASASASADRSGAGTRYEAGIEDLTVMKTTKSAFVGFERDDLTTLPETDDRIMATKVTATWGYSSAAAADPGFDFDAAHDRATSTLLAVLADHFSPSVQTSIWLMAKAMLETEPALDWVRMVLPNLHHWTFDTERFGIPNPGIVFVSTTEPHGLIDETVRRTG